MHKTTNLTRILNIEDAAVLHILDSLVLLPYINKAPEGALLDMGTGAGFPGIPLTITMHRKATYIDSVGKKVDAVNSFVDVLGLKHAHAVHDRLEEYARSHKKQFSVVTARAFLLSMLLHSSKTEGYLLSPRVILRMRSLLPACQQLKFAASLCF